MYINTEPGAFKNAEGKWDASKQEKIGKIEMYYA